MKSFIWTVLLYSTLLMANYPIVDTNQNNCYSDQQHIAAPAAGADFYGQDAQHDGNQPRYRDNGDGTISDLVTGLMWQQGYSQEKLTYEQAVLGASTFSLAGYSDWRLPTIKELYSLIDFSGVTGMSATDSKPYLNTTYFDFRYGLEAIGERYIDAQYASATTYTGTTMNGSFTMFGVNFADGRIKGYGTDHGKLFEVKYLRGNSEYGTNNFINNQDGTITDQATGLMWSRDDSQSGMTWKDALAWVQQKNQENYLGYSDWRLPNAKELQSIVDYSRSPQATNSAAIDPVFQISAITDEGGSSNYPFFWSSTTHLDGPPDKQATFAAYVAFGEALGFMEMLPNSGNYQLMDVHGAGAQRSDPKNGDPNYFPYGRGPQGDVIRIYNYVRLVRDVSQTTPVEFYGFNAQVQDNNVTLEWSTASEHQNLGFQIERSTDGETFVMIGTAAGHGTTALHSNYSFTDSSSSTGLLYYRIRQLDADGSFWLSSELTVNITLPDELTLQQNYPNPFNPVTTIPFTLPQAGEVRMDVYNTRGQWIETLLDQYLLAGMHQIEWNAMGHSAGLYWVRLRTLGQIATRKITYTP